MGWASSCWHSTRSAALMTRRLPWALSITAVLLGLGHLSIGAASFQQLSFDALWFTGSGIAIVLGGALNLLALLAEQGRAARMLVGAANLVMAGFFGLALAILPAPQVIVGLLLFAALAVIACLSGRRIARA